MTQLVLLPECVIDAVVPDGDGLVILAHRRSRSGRCPSCGVLSSSVHSRYMRQPSDLSCFGRSVLLRLRVRRFYCHDRRCGRRTFAERMPKLLAPRARRTRRAAKALTRIGLALGGEAGARLAGHLGMAASGDTILRLLHDLRVPHRTDHPVAVGIDDWAIRKGSTYGTIMVDLERRRPIDLLEGRTSGAVADWLRERPGIEVIARDRSTEYARAASEGAPQAVQVADRWHLLLNMSQAVERWAAQARGRLRKLPMPPDQGPDGALNGKRTRAFRRTQAEAEAGDAHRAHWGCVHAEVRRRVLAGESLSAIRRATGLARSTVRKLAHAETAPQRQAYGPGASKLDPHVAHLDARMRQGCENASALWREIVALGYAGTPRQVLRYVAQRRSVPSATTPKKWIGYRDQRNALRAKSSSKTPLPSPRAIAWAMTRPEGEQTPDRTALLARLEQDAQAKRVADLARRFTTLVRAAGTRREQPTKKGEDDPAKVLDQWIDEASTCGITPIATFAAGIGRDIIPVRAAITTPWSNGQTEGQINRLKTLKRQMYGRASFDLLRKRMLLTA